MMLSMEMIQMHIKTVICDIDGTLMAPGGGLYVSEQVKQKMIDLQEKEFSSFLHLHVFSRGSSFSLSD